MLGSRKRRPGVQPQTHAAVHEGRQTPGQIGAIPRPLRSKPAPAMPPRRANNLGRPSPFPLLRISRAPFRPHNTPDECVFLFFAFSESAHLDRAGGLLAERQSTSASPTGVHLCKNSHRESSHALAERPPQPSASDQLVVAWNSKPFFFPALQLTVWGKAGGLNSTCLMCRTWCVRVLGGYPDNAVQGAMMP